MSNTTVSDLQANKTVYYVPTYGNQTPVHVNTDCWHLDRAERLFESKAGLLDQGRPLCKDCLGDGKHAREKGYNTNATRAKLLETDPRDVRSSE